MANPQQTMFNNAMKLTYLVEQYPEHTAGQIFALMIMPPIQINTALWYAIDAGWVSKPDGETGEITLLKKPDAWEFGDVLYSLKHMIEYGFKKMAENETDMEEFGFNSWTEGYASHDIAIATMLLIAEGKLATYRLQDPKDLKSIYLYYTLPENRDKLWGRTQFKVQPTEAYVEPEKNKPSGDDAAESEN
jgi:hypothetical protein